MEAGNALKRLMSSHISAGNRRYQPALESHAAPRQPFAVMSARIFNLAQLHAAAVAPAPVRLPQQAPAREQSWRGASGRRYAHSVYSLIECPPLPEAGYILVKREPDGTRRALHVGLGRSDAPTVNLARVRQRGAQLGANEVHVHFHAGSDDERRLVACDLRAALFGTLGAELVGPDRQTLLCDRGRREGREPADRAPVLR